MKFLSRGMGSAQAALIYLLQKHDHKGELRAKIDVLRGNPELVTELADSLSFKHRYTSGVIAWHVDDNPTDKQIQDVLDDFERVAFAGLEPNQYSFYAVLHEEDDGSKHIHIITPRVELSTGLSMNIAPPAHHKTYDVLVDKYNVKNNWASPKDIHRRKLVNTKVDIHSDTKHTEAKILIHESVMKQIQSGTIKNEDDVIDYLNSIDSVNVKKRRSKKTLSIEINTINKPIRLEGLAYEKGFDVRELREELTEDRAKRARESQADRDREYERISEVFERTISSRSEFNAEKYKPRTTRILENRTTRSTKDTANNSQSKSSSKEDSLKKPRGDRKRVTELYEQSDKPKQTRHNLSKPILFSRGFNVGWNFYSSPQPTNTNRKSNNTRRKRERINVPKKIKKVLLLAERRRSIKNETKYRTAERQLDDRIRERIKSYSQDTARDIQSRIRSYSDSLHGGDTEAEQTISSKIEQFTSFDYKVREHSARADSSDREAERNTGEIQGNIKKLAYQYQRETVGRIREHGEEEGAITKYTVTGLSAGAREYQEVSREHRQYEDRKIRGFSNVIDGERDGVEATGSEFSRGVSDHIQRIIGELRERGEKAVAKIKSLVAPKPTPRPPSSGMRM